MLVLVLAAQLALAPRAPISTDVIRSAPSLQTRPAIASNGEELFAVWEHRGDVIGSRIRADGTAIDTNLGISLQPTWVYDMRPSVIWNGESWVVVFFSGPQPWPLGAKLVEVNRGGEVITELRIIPDRDIVSIDIAWKGSAYLVVWRENPGPVRAQIFDRNFAKVGEELAIADDGFEVSVASNGGSFFVAWTHAGGTSGRAVASDGALGVTALLDAESAPDVDVASNGIAFEVLANDVIAVDPSGVVTARASLPPGVTQTSIAANGANWIVVWGSDNKLMTGALDAAMRFVREPSPLVTSGLQQRHPAIGVIDGRALVVYSEFPGGQEWLADIRSTFIGESSTTRLISSGLMHQEVADAAWAASTLGVLWFEGEGLGDGLRFGELSAGGVPLRGEGIRLADGVYPHLASNGTGFAAVVARSPRVEVDLLPNGKTVVVEESDGELPLIASNGRDYYVVWSHGADLRGRRVNADGTLGEVHTFAERLAGSRSFAQDIVWTGEKYVVLTYEVIGIKAVAYTVTATEVSDDGVPGTPVVVESGNAIYHGYRGRLAWNGETLSYTRSANDPAGSVRTRVGLDGPESILFNGQYAELQDVVWDGGEWLYAMLTPRGWELLRGDDSVPFETAQRPVLAMGVRPALVTSVRIDRIPNHLDQSVRRGFATFVNLVSRRRAVR